MAVAWVEFLNLVTETDIMSIGNSLKGLNINWRSINDLNISNNMLCFFISFLVLII